MPDGFVLVPKAIYQTPLKDQSEAKQLEVLRLQIDMRVIGLGWDQFKTKWSSKSDPTIGTVAHLKSLLLDIIAHEIAERRLKRLPTEAASNTGGLSTGLRQTLTQLTHVLRTDVTQLIADAR